MISKILNKLAFFHRDEHGQALPLIGVALVVIMGMCGIGVDVAHAFYVQRQLQAATDSAALAGAAALPDTSATTVATNYSANSGSLNARSSLAGATMVSGYPKIFCLNTLQNQGIACQAPGNGNAIQVKQQITMNTIFLSVLGKKSVLITASAMSAMRGANSTPYNVAIVLDSTLSMNMQDSNCGNTQMQCALNGIQILLQSLSPCAASHSTCTFNNGVAADPVDQVALFSFPNVTIGSASVDTNCPTQITASAAKTYGYYNMSSIGYYSMRNQTAWSGLAQATAYTYPSSSGSPYAPTGSTTGTYQITNFLSDYRLSDTSNTLNSNSAIVKAAGGASNCSGMLPPNYAGDYGTYYAGAIYAAADSLLAMQANNAGTQNVMIILSDGDANAPQTFNNGSTQSPTNVTVTGMPSPATSNGNYPSYKSECIQGYQAATAATGAGIRVYTVAYGSPTSGCSTDPSTYNGVNVTPCNVMYYMASAPQYFYSDYNQSGSTSNCVSNSQSVTSLNDIFTSIAADLTVARLIPDNTT